MSIKLSDLLNNLVSQQLPALTAILTKAKSHIIESGGDDQSLLATRLHDDMHPLSWQIKATIELIVRGVARVSGREPDSFELSEDTFEAIIARVAQVNNDLENLDDDAINENEETVFTIPLGSDGSLEMTGKDYVIKFLLPNVFFHLTTAYDLLRMNGVALSKRDYMGSVR